MPRMLPPTVRFPLMDAYEFKINVSFMRTVPSKVVTPPTVRSPSSMMGPVT